MHESERHTSAGARLGTFIAVFPPLTVAPGNSVALETALAGSACRRTGDPGTRSCYNARVDGNYSLTTGKKDLFPYLRRTLSRRGS
jgi:cytochrome c1